MKALRRTAGAATVLATAAALALTAPTATAAQDPAPVTCRDPDTGEELPADRVGTDGDDHFTIHDGVVVTLAGDDTVFVEHGSLAFPVACLGPGDDWFGNVFPDTSGILTAFHTAHGEDGDDTLLGNRDHDDLLGGPGHDTIDGRGGADDLRGGPGDDTIDGGRGDDTVIGGEGHDTVDGGPGIDRCEAEVEINCER
ncbi:hypothetical protein V1L54_02445 [Streptomyces sp. TRM 70361]|uniref:calcium-binding protein n=1 Tax=Streptomyces sp. TRM 70361 TaxID=3116553 RepID=UPI002E7BA024|nr:hypothetical protein [Streptomyces sp. TRM 70361]MEE1938281.1 hypothetical protein [Streptomyces sp. TRM 70361]